MAKLKQLKQRVDEAEYAEESEEELPLKDTMDIKAFSYHSVLSIRMEVKEQGKMEKQALKSFKEARSDMGVLSTRGMQQTPGSYCGYQDTSSLSRLTSPPQMEISYKEAS